MFPIDHIGIAVTDLDQSIRQYSSDFGFTLSLRETVPTQHVEVAFLQTGNTLIELLVPINKQGTLQKFIDKRGPGLHHICFKVSDLEAELKRLSLAGYKLIDSIPRPGAHNSKIAFLHPASMDGVLLELCQHS